MVLLTDIRDSTTLRAQHIHFFNSIALSDLPFGKLANEYAYVLRLFYHRIRQLFPCSGIIFKRNLKLIDQ